MTTAIRQEIESAVPNPPLKSGLGLLPSPEEMPDIFRELGVSPIRDLYWSFTPNGSVCGLCAISAAYAARTPEGIAKIRSDFPPSHIDMEDAIGMSSDFGYGAINGFDGEDPFPGQSDHVEYDAGFEWGRAARQACVKAGLVDDVASSLALVESEVA